MDSRPLCFTCGVAPATIREKREPRLVYCQAECQQVLYQSHVAGLIEIGEALGEEEGQRLLLIGDDMDALPEDDFEAVLMRLPPRGLVAFAKASRRAQAFASDPKFRLRYMKRQKIRMRLIMRTLCTRPDIMLDWMPQALENNIWDPRTSAHQYGDMTLNALEEAALNGRVAVVRYLLVDGRVAPTQQALENAIVANSEGSVALLLADPRLDPTAYAQRGFNGHILTAITETRTPAILRLLLADGRADPGLLFSHALWVATSAMSVEHARALLEDPRVLPNDTIMRTAIEKQSLPLLDLFLNDGRADPVEAWQFMKTRWGPSRWTTKDAGKEYREGFDRAIEARLLQDPRIKEYLADPAAWFRNNRK